MKNLKNKKFYEKYAWVFFLIIGIMILIGAIPHTFGINTDPALVQNISGKTIEELEISSPLFYNLYNFYFRGGGLSDLGFAFLLLAISLFAYKQGQKWAWYVFWFIPVYFLAWVVLSSTLPPKSQLLLLPPLIVIIVLSLLGLLLPFRKFFPSKEIE